MLKRSFHSSTIEMRAHDVERRRGLVLTIASVALVAATYGMARFGVGLLHPQMAAARPGLSEGLRSAGTAQFASYCVAVLIGGQLARSRARAVSLAAGLSAAFGCVGLLVAHTPVMFTMSAFIAGTGAGLASPALVPLLDRAVPARRAGAAQTAVNSGTAIGLVISGSLVLITTGIILPWVLIAVICVAAGSAVYYFAGEPRAEVDAPTPTPDAPATSQDLKRLVAPLLLAAAAGAVSAFVWTYGPSVIVREGLVDTRHIGWLWVAVGLGGLLGVLTSQLVQTVGPLRSFLLSTAGIILSTGGVLLAGQQGAAIVALALFGASYMILSGTLILWGRVLRPGNGGQATAWLFLALAAGQVVGASTMSP